MYRVIDTIEQRREWLQHHPELQQSEGLLAVLDPSQLTVPFRRTDRVRILRPDGSSLILEVSEVRIGTGGVVGLLFPPASPVQIPPGSMIEPL